MELLPNEKVLIVAPDHNPFKELVAKKHCDLSFIEKEILTDGTTLESLLEVEEMLGMGHRMLLNPNINYYQKLKAF